MDLEKLNELNQVSDNIKRVKREIERIKSMEKDPKNIYLNYSGSSSKIPEPILKPVLILVKARYQEELEMLEKKFQEA